MATPSRSRRSATNPSTPNSVDSRGTAGVPWHVKKLVAQELEDLYPLHLCPGQTNSATALANTGLQPISRFLDNLLDKDPENNAGVGNRGDPIREQIGDLIRKWRLKHKEEYRKRVVVRHQIVQTPQRTRKGGTAKAIPKQKDSDSDSDSDSSYPFLTPIKPKETPTKAAAPKTKTPEVKMSDDFRLLSDGTLEGLCLFKNCYFSACVFKSCY